MADEPKAPAATPQTPPAQGAAPQGQTPPAASPPAQPDRGGSIYSDIGAETPKPGTWPEDWREQIAKDLDPKVAERFKRFQSPTEIAKSFLAAEQRIRSGEYKRVTAPPQDPEQLKAWRTEQDIPEAADGYEIVPQAEFDKLSDAEKADFNVLREGLHAANLPRGVAKQVADAAIKMAAQQQERTAQADATNWDANEDTLRAEWGSEYRKNIEANKNFIIRHFGEDGLDELTMARTPSGMRLADMPQFNKFLNMMARLEGNGEFFEGDVPGAKGLDGEIESIREIMRTDFARYTREKMGDKLTQLLEKKEARGGRAA